MNRNFGAFAPSLDDMRGSFYDTFGALYGGLAPAQSGGGTTVPDTVFVGCSPTYSMPTDHIGTAEYVTSQVIIPSNWDTTSHFRCMVWFAQADAETTGEKYVWNLQNCYANNGDTLGTYANTAGTLTLGASGTTQYAIRCCEFTVPRSNGFGTAEPGGLLNFKLHRRILGTTGEALLMGVQFGYWGTVYGGTSSGSLSSKVLASLRVAH